MDLILRDGTASDLEFIVEANRRLALESEEVELDLGLLRPGVAAVLADRSRGRYFIAQAGGRPLGQMMLTYEWSDWRNGSFWWIQSVYVDDAHRGQGVFSALFRHAAGLASADPAVCGLRLYVDRANVRAQEIYAHLGLHASNYEFMEKVFRGPASRRED
ncbi:MAG: GNAT family N-acetyltransferase [Steroidobacteraceae bacterium]|jgi:GNAT superfamily N-acetyltransferase|nr:GNAT family N-acetyltransferase [Steroidobacteraceae bacterium]